MFYLYSVCFWKVYRIQVIYKESLWHILYIDIWFQLWQLLSTLVFLFQCPMIMCMPSGSLLFYAQETRSIYLITMVFFSWRDKGYKAHVLMYLDTEWCWREYKTASVSCQNVWKPLCVLIHSPNWQHSNMFQNHWVRSTMSWEPKQREVDRRAARMCTGQQCYVLSVVAALAMALGGGVVHLIGWWPEAVEWSKCRGF